MMQQTQKMAPTSCVGLESKNDIDRVCFSLATRDFSKRDRLSVYSSHQKKQNTKEREDLDGTIKPGKKRFDKAPGGVAL